MRQQGNGREHFRRGNATFILIVALQDALDGPTAPAAARQLPMLQTLRDVWRVHYARDDGPLR